LAGKSKNNTPKILDVVGLDLGTTSTKLVRLRKTAGKLSLVEADVMPTFDVESAEEGTKITIPKKLNAPYAAAALTSNESHVRFMFIPSKLSDQRAIRQRVGKSLGLGRDFRVGFSMVERGKEEQDHKVLAAAIPEPHVQTVRRLIPYHHPSLISLEIAGLSALNSFSHTPAVQEAEGIVCYLEAGAASLFISFFLDGTLRLVRKFNHGSLYIQQRIQDVLNINEDDALTVLFEDASPLVDQGMDPINTMAQELSISCKFVERNESSEITTVYASGGLSYSPYWAWVIEEIMGVEVQVWNPFAANGIKSYPKGVHGVESMFSPAVGAALSVMVPSS
jgi:Tfp pilus assembly PilM family ATPase